MTFADCWKPASRWWYVLRYHRPSQLIARAAKLATRQLPVPRRWREIDRAGMQAGLRENSGFESLRVAHVDSRDRQRSLDRADRILDGSFMFLNDERRLCGCGLETRLGHVEGTGASGSFTRGNAQPLAAIKAAASRQGIDWRADVSPPVSHLWRFQLHYHEFLLDLAAAAEGTDATFYLDAAWRIVTDWIDGNPPTDQNLADDAWHPYCVSRRLPVWTVLWQTSPPSPDCAPSDTSPKRKRGSASNLSSLARRASVESAVPERQGRCSDRAKDQMAIRVRASMAAQAQYLSRHLEWDLRGNHLLENAKALAIAGAFFEGNDAERWLNIAERILRSEMPDQLLPDGQHFERSPMYHALMLQALLDVRDVVAPIRPGFAEFCQACSTKMAGWLETVLHPDGRIPLLSDSTFDEAPDVELLLARTKGQQQVSGFRCQVSGKKAQTSDDCGQTSKAVARGDIWTWRDGGDFLIFDAGPVGADHLPAHAHNDLLTIEASLGGKRFIVDSGTFDYSDGPMREYCRSTRAHNVLQIDDAEQCDMWSRFRMGYRGWPSDFQTGGNHGFAWARACHNAYRRLGVPMAGRWIACRTNGPWLCVDWANGRGVHQLTHWLHFHPNVQITSTADNEVELTIGENVARLRHLLPGEISIETAWYCPEFGERIEAPVVRWSKCCELPVAPAWCLTWSDGYGDVEVKLDDRGTVVVTYAEEEDRWEWEVLGLACRSSSGT